MLTAFAAYAALALARPQSNLDSHLLRRTDDGIQQFPADVHGADRAALPAAPANLSSDLRSFLEKYQPLSNAASSQIGPKDEARFSAVGHCFAEFPCFSVERGAAATIGDKQEVTQVQVSAILDNLTSSSTVTFGPAQGGNSRSGLKITANEATLEVIAVPSTMSANFLAGMVFDMFKMQHDDPATNSIRAVQAKTDGKDRPFVALCLYPANADATQVHNFCLGNHLDGTPIVPAQRMAKRFSLEGGFGFLCGIVDLPLLCEDTIG